MTHIRHKIVKFLQYHKHMHIWTAFHTDTDGIPQTWHRNVLPSVVCWEKTQSDDVLTGSRNEIVADSWSECRKSNLIWITAYHWNPQSWMLTEKSFFVTCVHSISVSSSALCQFATKNKSIANELLKITIVSAPTKSRQMFHHKIIIDTVVRGCRVFSMILCLQMRDVPARTSLPKITNWP